MTDVENNSIEQVAPVNNEAQNEQVVTTAEVTNSPEISADKEEMILGKFKSVDDLAKSYQALERKFSQERTAPEPVEQVPAPQDFVPEVGYMANEVFDQETVAGVRQLIAQERENERAQEFIEKHGTELKENRLLASVVKDIIRENNQSGKRIDQFKALELAKQEINKLTAPKVTEAKAQGEQEGREVANKKELLGAIGSAPGKQEFDVNKLSSKEYAEYHGLSYVE